MDSGADAADARSLLPVVKSEPGEPILDFDPQIHLSPSRPSLADHGNVGYTVYRKSDQIRFGIQPALSECLSMADAIGKRIEDLNLEVSKSRLRKDMWMRTLSQIRDKAQEKTFTAVCGATGAGKSSLINAILDVSILPTSGGQACTSVVTEISWHDDTMFIADVVFLSEEEWLEELLPLHQDLKDADLTGEPRKELKEAWDKFRAVYPDVRESKELKKVASIAGFVRSDQATYPVLGKTTTIKNRQKDSFVHELQQYVKAEKHSSSNAHRKRQLWPLIKVVKVRCNAPALTSGAVLVDLPGTADANRARASIATTYMKQCSHVWIVTNIRRAVDDQNAQGECQRQSANGTYDDSRIALIATQTDLISPSEMLGDGGLDDTDDTDLKDVIQKEKEANDEKNALKRELDRLFAATPHAQHVGQVTESRGSGRKRRDSVSCPDVASKRTRLATRTTRHAIECQVAGTSDTSIPQSRSVDWQQVPMCTSADSLREATSAHDRTDEIEWIRVKCAELEMELCELVARKRVLCSLKRSRESLGIMRRNFIDQLKDLDAAAAEEKDPDNYDPSEPLRDYSRVDPPVFSCSALDYLRIQSHVVGDGDPNCFSDPGNTGIPSIQEWCRNLGDLCRRRSLPGIWESLEVLAESVHRYVKDVSLDDVTKVDSEVMRKQCQSGLVSNIGIANIMKECLHRLADDRSQDLHDSLSTSLGWIVRAAALKAGEKAEQISDAFAAGMHWQTYKGTLRRNGVWRQDLNLDLTLPFMLGIAAQWSKVFSDRSLDLKEAATSIVNQTLSEVEESATPLLKDLAHSQAEHCRRELQQLLDDIVRVIDKVLEEEQRTASRCLAPHIMDALKPAYEEAFAQSGPGSVARRKNIFHNWITKLKNSVFDDGADVLLTLLEDITTSVGERLKREFDVLSERMEVTMSVLWDRPGRENRLELKACVRATATTVEVKEQIPLWRAAANLSMN
ncbi:uncharacterized protein C8Q71DRAFT_777988 [Rhodofomes roseus]|uniref:Nuclear GTPase SLIP-GC n=1 Tax=Rhodofomes roseus TaxID=34475 RepID=A0ABQ8K5H3_9APHY|nr:uncharacterized protein C8Q71DRAFT_777988 [Rhodofomes roseus]KAH9832230.1 hypothetical protein C8Q71DRAFT_777988 [Rhodofomes roseus]